MGFSEHDVPPLEGRTVIITGANSGIGLEAADILASRGARVVMACRSMDKGRAALERIRRHPHADVELRGLDLADLSSVRAFVDRLAADHRTVDVLVNNAGVMALPFGRTVDGFERQIGTNHLGHFALTARLSRTLDAPPKRVVTVASVAHRWGKLTLSDLHRARGYRAWLAYGQSKLANLLFMKELARRATEIISVACHPGYAGTNLLAATAKEHNSSLGRRFWDAVNAGFAQSARDGALPTVFAAVSDTVRSGDYYGPSGLLEMRGPPVKVSLSRAAESHDDASALWDLGERLTGESFEL